MALGRVVRIGSWEQAEKLGIHCSPFDMIPKDEQIEADLGPVLPRGGMY